MDKLIHRIRNIEDFPKPGILFKDITPLLADAECFQSAINSFRQRLQDRHIDVVVGIEARGFIFAGALAYALHAGTCMVRKPGKLPHTCYRKSYELEYGTDALEIHVDAFRPKQRIVILDDVLATGGTVAATARLIEEHFDVEIVEIDFLMELTFLKGRQQLDDWPVFTLLSC